MQKLFIQQINSKIDSTIYKVPPLQINANTTVV